MTPETAKALVEAWADDQATRPSLSSDEFTSLISAIAAAECGECAELERERDELLANNMRSFITEIKSRLLPEEADQFQTLLDEAGKEWMREVLSK